MLASEIVQSSFAELLDGYWCHVKRPFEHLGVGTLATYTLLIDD